MSRTRRVTYTVNFPEGEEDTFPLLDPELWEKCTYNVYQLEIAPQTGKLHYQGYMEFSAPMRWNILHRYPGIEEAHFESTMGTAEDNYRYCTKEESRVDGPWEWGERTRQGRRNDLADIQKRLEEGDSMKIISKDHFSQWLQYSRPFKQYKRLHTAKRDFKTIVICLWGASGTGKTKFAYNLAKYLGSSYTSPVKHTGFWNDDYEGEDSFIIDEMTGARMSPTTFKMLADRYEFVLSSHGDAGHQFVSRYIIITSNYHPLSWWQDRTRDEEIQILRRMELIIEFSDVPHDLVPLDRHLPQLKNLTELSARPRLGEFQLDMPFNIRADPIEAMEMDMEFFNEINHF